MGRNTEGYVIGCEVGIFTFALGKCVLLFGDTNNYDDYS